MSDQLARMLGTLRYVDSKTVELYGQVIPRAGDAAEPLSDYHEDHQRHVAAFDRLCEAEGWETAEPSEETLKLAEEYLTMARVASDRQTSMYVLLLAERTNAMLYAEADRLDLPGEVQELVGDHLADEGLHVAYLEENVPSISSMISMPLDGDESPVLCVTGGLTDDRSPDDFE